MARGSEHRPDPATRPEPQPGEQHVSRRVIDQAAGFHSQFGPGVGSELLLSELDSVGGTVGAVVGAGAKFPSPL